MCNTPRPPGRRQGRPRTDENRLDSIYGDHIKQKKKGMVRILFQNPQGLGPLSDVQGCQTSKINTLKDTLLKHQIDLVGLSEINKDWRLVPQKETMWNITDNWFEYRRLATSFNSAIRPTTRTQFGGTLLLAINRIAYSIDQIDSDPRKIGRWTSMLFRGKNNQRCRVICAYCPCISTGTTSTYALQSVALAQENIMECPRKQFWIDLHEFLGNCTQRNEQIVLMGDWNSDYDEIKQWMFEHGLKDIIQSRHSHTSPPPTCNRSRDSPIDIIFTSDNFTCWRGGFFSFNYLEGDHRGIWCDIPIEYILGYNMQHLAHVNARRLKTNDPRVRKRYLTKLNQLLQTEDVYPKMDKLYATTKSRWIPTDSLHFESLDDTITQAMETAERRCRKINAGIIKWSPQYQRSCDKVTYWKLTIQQMAGRHSNTRKIRSLRKKLNLTITPTSIQDAKEQMNKAIKERKKCKKYAAELQLEYRHRLALAKEEEDNIPAATHVRNLIRQENTRSLFRRIRYLEKKMTNLSTSRITVTSSNGQEQEITQRERMEDHIMRSNEKKFHQTEGHSQLQKGQLLKDIGTMGTGPKVQMILEGTYRTPPGTSNTTKQFISMMKRPPEQTRIAHITYKEFCRGWTKAKERTSSNGPHFGHYKAAIHHGKIGQLLYKRSLIPMLTGYSPRRHREGIDVMLLKKEKNYNVDSLRTIVLFDSEANMNYKHLGRRAMTAAISQGHIATEQYSRPNRKAIDHAINRRLVMDHQLYLRQPYAFTSCDLKSCYDRIIHSAAGLSLQKLGMSSQELTSMFYTIQHMSHKVRTAYGDSKQSFGGARATKWKLPPQGILQGNGSGPAVWSILSSNLFHILQAKGHRNKFVSSIRKTSIELAGFAYVDDTDLVQTHDEIPDVVKNMQRTLNTWTEAIGVTGGILSPQKCWWYLVSFKYIKGKWIGCDAANESQIYIQDGNNKNVTIQKISTSIGTNMLGVHLAPDGNHKDQLMFLRKKAEAWATNLRECHANKEEVWTALHRTIPFSIGYSLPALTLNPGECNYVMAPVHSFGLPRAGIPATIPSSIRHGPRSMNGLGLMDPYIKMGVGQLETYISNTWTQTPTGQLLEVVMDDVLMEMGLQSPFDSSVVLKRGLTYATTSSWIRHLMQFIVDNDITIKTDVTDFSAQRQRDRTIMDLATASTTHKPTLMSINKVRMQLQVVWISDISTADGRFIDKRCLSSTTTFPKRNNYNWPKKHYTTATDWRRWRTWIRSITHHENFLLQEPLGRWTQNNENWTQTWDCLATVSKELLYIRSDDGRSWNRHIRLDGRNRRILRYHAESLTHSLIPENPRDLHRVSVQTYQGHIDITSWSTREERIDHPHLAFFEHHLQPSRNSILDSLQSSIQPEFLDATNDIGKLLQDFRNGTVVSVSDGSYYPELGKAAGAWIIESSCRQEWIIGAMTVQGHRDDFNSYRSELTGLLGISVTLRTLATCFPAPQHAIIGCDGKAALQSLILNREDINANSKHADILSSIIDIWTSFRTRPVPVHIAGHQDQERTALTRLEKMNVMMDKLATMTAATFPPRDSKWKLYGTGIRQVLYKQRIITGNLTQSLYNELTATKIWDYYSHKVFQNHQISKAQICWKALEYARAQSSTGRLIFVSKWVSNCVATGKVMQRRKHRVFNRCPRCDHWGEDREHVLRCWDPRATIIWNRQLELIKTSLEKEKTDPEITDFIVQGLNAFRRTREPGSFTHQKIWQEEQSQLGWMNFLSGFISSSLVATQQQYYHRIRSRKGGNQWAKKVIIQNWTLLHNMWTGRNTVLHQKDIINSLSGDTLLDIEVEKEYDLGYAELPPSAKKWFRQSKEQLLASTTDYKKGWLLIIRTMKESLQIAEYSIFSSSKTLRNWIGLTNPRELQI
jgi:exonuclease III